MSTRAIYTFKDSDSTHHVYVHYDGYPSGAAQKFSATLESGKIWDLPRFEADEFSAGFVASNKDSSGSIRLTKSRRACCDVEYGYTVTMVKGVLTVACHETNFWDDKKSESLIWKGPMLEFIAIAETL